MSSSGPPEGANGSTPVRGSGPPGAEGTGAAGSGQPAGAGSVSLSSPEALCTGRGTRPGTAPTRRGLMVKQQRQPINSQTKHDTKSLLFIA